MSGKPVQLLPLCGKKILNTVFIDKRLIIVFTDQSVLKLDAVGVDAHLLVDYEGQIFQGNKEGELNG